MEPADRITSPRRPGFAGLPLDRPGDAGGALAIEKHALHQRVGDDLQVRTVLDRVQVTDRGAAASSPAAGLLEIAGALLVGAIEIIVARDANLFGRIDEYVA